MKKLNRKGFTLVELLAVIIILAIVVGITIPAVLTTTNKTKNKAGITAAQTLASWIDSEYNIAKFGLSSAGVATLNAFFEAQCGATGADCECTLGTKTGTTNITTSASTTQKGRCISTMKKTAIADANFLTAAGLKTSNVTNVDVSINSETGKSCVKLHIQTTGDYYTNTATLCGSGEVDCYVDQTTIKAGYC